MCKLLQLAGAAYKLVRAATCIAGVGRALTCIDQVNTPTRYAPLRPTVTAALFILTLVTAMKKSWIDSLDYEFEKWWRMGPKGDCTL